MQNEKSTSEAVEIYCERCRFFIAFMRSASFWAIFNKIHVFFKDMCLEKNTYDVRKFGQGTNRVP